MRPWTAPWRKQTLRALLPVLSMLGPNRAARLLATMGQWEVKVNPRRRRIYAAALASLGQRLGCDWDIERLAPRLAGNLWRWDARDCLLDNLSEARWRSALRVVGAENLDRAVRMNRGALLLFNHFGPFLIPAHWIVRRGHTLRWFTERPRHISSKLSETFQSDGPLGQRSLFLNRRMTASQGTAALRKAVRMLESGMIVQAAGDVRWQGQRCVKQDFLGYRFSFTSNWVSIAALSGAPVVPVYSVLEPEGTYRIVFDEPELIGRECAQPDGAGYWIRRNLDRVEACIRAYPDNCGEYAFWPAPPPVVKPEPALARSA